MNTYILVIVILSLSWHICLSTHECQRTINGGEMTFICPSNISSQTLRLFDLTAVQLDSITSFVADSVNDTSFGPFTSIPPNICLLRNLQSIDFSFNQITQVDPTGSLTNCLLNVITLDLSYNNISEFPSFLIYNMPKLKNLYFQHNQLTEVPSNAFINVSLLEIIDFSYNKLTTFEMWTLEVQTEVDFSNNQITTITNKYFFDNNVPIDKAPNIFLTNNGPTINFTDAVYEMYNQCDEVYDWYIDDTNIPTGPPYFTYKLAQMNFGTTQITCSCDQAYFLRIIADSYIDQVFPIHQTKCTNNSRNINDTIFLNSSCGHSGENPNHEINSTVDFSRVYPRLCKITDDEEGTITNITRTLPTSNAPIYPHYETAFLEPGACFFTFSNSTTMRITCTNDTSNSLSKIPQNLLSNAYMSNITRVTFSTSISSFPSYLCSLPSHIIDLSFQSFTILNDETFPCLDSFYTINLSFNQITSVNMANGNFKNLTSLDLSSNRLTMLPYSILRPTPTSLRYLDLRNNSINYLDLFLFTLQNITINLDNNPINTSNIINPQNVTVGNTNSSTANITFPPNVVDSTIIIQDTIATQVGLCTFTSLRNHLNFFRSITSNVLLDCTCVSINLRDIYQQNGYNILNEFNCSRTGDRQTFPSLTRMTCPNAINMQTGLCSNQTNPPITSTLPSETGPTGTIPSQPNSSNTGLIVGLVVGLVGGLALIGGVIGAIVYLKAKGAAAAGKKPVTRAIVNSQTPGESLQSRVQSRNLRSVRLAPIVTPSSQLPTTPVAAVIPPSNSSILSYNTNLRTAAKGIPVQLEPISSPSNINLQYPPNSNALTNSSSFRPINKPSTNQLPISQQQYQAPKPQKTNQMLNAGGDTRY